MKPIVSLLLALLLAACPYLCRADSRACCADHCEESGAPDDDSKAPNPSPAEAVSCVCAGAIRDSNSELDAKAKPGEWSPDVVPLASILPSHWMFLPVARSGAPPGRPACGPVRVHLLLQNLRC